MEQINLDEIVEKFKDRLVATKEAEKFRKEVIEPFVEDVFEKEFIQTFNNIASAINEKVGTEVIRSYIESKNKYVIEGLYHRVFFQLSSIDIITQTAYVNIIPVYVWKGITKHLGPISLILNTETQTFKWDIPYNSIENYASKIFKGFTEDKDFTL
jgi:hypothetical protein